MRWIALSLALILPQSASAQVGVPAQRERTNAFLNSKKSIQAERANRIARTKGPAAQGELLALIKALNFPVVKPPFESDSQRLSQLNESFYVDVAQRLLLLGFSPGDIRRPQGAEIARAAARYVRGLAESRDFALLSTDVVTADLVEIQLRRGNDFNSLARLRVASSFKGPLKAGDEILVPRTSGRLADGSEVTVSDEIPAERGAQFGLYLSRALPARPPTTSAPGVHFAVVGPAYRVSGSALVPLSFGARTSSIAELTSSTSGAR